MAAARGARNILLMGAPGVGKVRGRCGMRVRSRRGGAAELAALMARTRRARTPSGWWSFSSCRMSPLATSCATLSGRATASSPPRWQQVCAAWLCVLWLAATSRPADTRAGRLISDEEMTRMLRKRLSQDDVRHGVLLDGYPRNVAQVALLKSILPVTSVLHITLREDLIIRKATARRMCGTCGRIYNLAHIMEGSVRMPALAPKRDGVCDDCGGALEHRADDKMETVVERLRLYKELTEPVLDVLRKEVPIVNFHLTSGVADMMPKLEELCKAQSWLP
jgi:adenylate kinase family enzyme